MKYINQLLLTLGLLWLAACAPEQQKTIIEEASNRWPHGVTYEIFVQSFCDSNGDGIGDLNGMTSKLDYLVDLGVEAVWLMPVMPSPTYHKYDVTDYYDVHQDYGTKEDFQRFVQEAHLREIKVVIDLVINHTSNQHPWFQEAVVNPESKYRDYFVWATEQEIKDEGSLTKEVSEDSDNLKQWHQAEGNQERYYGFFWGGMPDLNFDNPEVVQEIFQIGEFWLSEMDVDGFRLDAAKHIFPDHRPQDNHQWWIDFRQEMEKFKPDVYLIGEVWADLETVAPYLQGLNAVFNFDLSNRIAETIKKGSGPDLAAFQQHVLDFYQDYSSDFIDATFLTNHDQNRIMSVLNGNQEQAKLAASMLMTLPGAPYIYYGEEIGMTGMKPDEQIREPFLWAPQAEDSCRTTWEEPVYSTEQNVPPLSLQQQDPNSIYSHYKSLIHTRKSSDVLALGAIAALDIAPGQLSSFYRFHQGDTVLVLHNLAATPITLLPGDWPARFDAMHNLQDGATSETDQSLTIPAYGSLLLKKSKAL